MAVLHRKGVRRLLNMDKLHSWDEFVKTLNEYSKKLERSGYSARTRADVIQAAIQTNRRMKNDEVPGRRPLYRPRTWHKAKRILDKESRKSSWSKTAQRTGEVAGASLIIYPQAGNALNDKMKSICKNFLEYTNIHVKVVTRPGR